MATFTYLSIFKTKWIIWTVSQEVSHGLNLLPEAFQEKRHRPLIVSQFPKTSAVPFLSCSIYLPWTDIPTFHHPLAFLWTHLTSNLATFSVPNNLAKRTTLHLILEPRAMLRFSCQRFWSPLYKIISFFSLCTSFSVSQTSFVEGDSFDYHKLCRHHFQLIPLYL